MAIPTNLPQREYIQGLWHLDEESGNRADSSGNDNTLTDNNTVLYDTGKIGNAASFNRTNSEYLSITDAAQSGLDLTGSFAISFWIDVNNPGAILDLLSKYYATGNNRSYRILLQANNTLEVSLSDNGTTDAGHFIQKTAAGISNGAGWQHVCVVLDGANTKIYIYIDNSAVVNGDASTISGTYNGSADFMLGRTQAISYYYNGLLDEVIIWNKALTADEVEDVYDITKYKYATGGILNWWFFKDAWEKHDKLWTPKLAIPKLGYQI